MRFFNHITRQVISHLTDVEGNLQYLQRWATRSKQLALENGVLSFRTPEQNQKFVYGGDFCDKGPGDLRIGQALNAFKAKAPRDVTLIAGNREIKNRRFTYELDSSSIRKRLLHGQAAFWNKKSSPRDYVLQQMHHEGKLQTSNVDVEGYINEQSIEACQTLYLKWMLNETMGCASVQNRPNTFEYRRMELAEIAGQARSQINDETVTRSFIDSVSSNGVVTQYLEQAQLGIILGETLFIHGAITLENMGYIPGMSESQPRISDAREWVDMLNGWYAKQIKEWLEHPTEDHLHAPGHKPLDQYVLFNPKSIVTTNWYQQGRLAPIPAPVIDYLNKAGIYRVVSGHQPFSDFPLIIRNPALEVIVGDTGYSDPSAKEDARGIAIHNLEIHQLDGHGFASIDIVRRDGADMHLILPSQSQIAMGINDTLVGHFTETGGLIRPSDGQLLAQCQLEGFNVVEEPLSENKPALK